MIIFMYLSCDFYFNCSSVYCTNIQRYDDSVFNMSKKWMIKLATLE